MVAKAKKPYRRKPWERNKGDKPNVKPHQSEASSRTYTSEKRNISYYYCSKSGQFAKECRKNKFQVSKYKRHTSHFVDREETISDDLKISSCLFQM